MLRQTSGLGAAARACHDSLRDAGLPVYGIDLTRALMHEANYADFAFEDGSHLIGEGTILLHVSGSIVPLAMNLLGRRFVRSKRVIAHWFWELPRLPEDWRHGVQFVHEICVNTRFVADAVRPIAGGRPVHVVPYPLPLTNGFPRSGTCEAVGEADRLFTVLVIFNVASNFARKNPCAAIDAFRKAFGDDPSARLIVKYSNASAWPEGVSLMLQAAHGADNIVLNGDLLSATGMEALYGEADVVLSLHRAEGLGLVVAEAMLRGLPVVATDWSGNTDFLSPDTGMPVDYTLVPVADPQGNYRDPRMMWAEVDIDMAADRLRKLRAQPSLRQALGTAASAHAARIFGPANYGDRIKELLV
jgi:glycosyltransferase involved in cell wall biosynthesis